jgi:hypothetical protein
MRREIEKREEKKKGLMETRSIRLKGQATGGVKGRDWQRLQQERGKGERLGRPRYNKQPPAMTLRAMEPVDQTNGSSEMKMNTSIKKEMNFK